MDVYVYVHSSINAHRKHGEMHARTRWVSKTWRCKAPRHTEEVKSPQIIQQCPC